MYRSLLVLLFSGLLLVGGCSSEPSDAEKAPRVRTTNLTEDQVMQKAKDIVRQHDSFADSAEYDVEAAGDAGWQVTVESSAGDVRLILLDGNGEVIKYETM